MLHTIIWFAYFWLYLLAALPALIYVRHLKSKGDIKRHDELTRLIIHNWSRRLLKAAGAEVTVFGEQNLPSDTLPAVYVANHQGYFDIPMVLGYLGGAKALVAKKEIKKIPLIRSWMEELGCVFIDRENPRASMAALNEAAALVAAGYPVVVFPEGTRSKTGEMADFKAGAFRIAQKNHVPVVPFFIDGTAELLERNHWKIKGGRVAIGIMPTIDTAQYTREDWKALPALSEGIVRDALEKYRLEK